MLIDGPGGKQLGTPMLRSSLSSQALPMCLLTAPCLLHRMAGPCS